MQLKINFLKRIAQFRYLILGGRLRYSARKNVVNPGTFVALQVLPDKEISEPMPFCKVKIPPA